MPQLVRMYVVNVGIGFLLALIFTSLLIALDIAHLRHLVMASGLMGALAVLMLVIFNTILFAGVQFAIAVMRLAGAEPPPQSGRRLRVHRQSSQAVPVAVATRGR